MHRYLPVLLLALVGCAKMEPQSWSGTGSQNTPTFDASSEWIVSWERDEGGQQAETATAMLKDLGLGKMGQMFAVSVYRDDAKDANDVHAIACSPGSPAKGGIPSEAIWPVLSGNRRYA